MLRKRWNERDASSRAKVQRLLRGEPIETYGLGLVRTLQEYERYAGLSFSKRKAQQYTVRGGEPPNPPLAPDWVDRVYLWIARARFKRADLQAQALEDPILWNLVIRDEEGFEICRRDLGADELTPFAEGGEDLALICEFDSETAPASWSIWPLTRSAGWMRKIGGSFSGDDFSILKEDEEGDRPG